MEIVKLGTDIDCSIFSSFDCRYRDGYEIATHLKKEIDDLCSYLPERAKYACERGFGVSYTAYIEGNLVGFFSINAGHIRFDDDEFNRINGLEELSKKPYTNFPAVKVVQLAVQSEYQGNTEIPVGGLLVSAIQAISYNLSKDVGIRFLKVDALADYRTLKFYTKMGFHPHYDRNGLEKYQKIMDRTYRGDALSVSMYLDLQKTRD